jgi:Protein of unknown function (DUF1161)
MKRMIWVLIVAFSVGTAFAQRKSCEDLKTEISSKLDAKGVKNYELTIVAVEDVKDEMVVGSCDGGTKRITYTRK